MTNNKCDNCKNIQQELSNLWHVIDQSPSLIVMTDLEGNIEYVNDKFTEVTGYLKEGVIGENPRFLKSGEMAKDEYKIMWETLLDGKEWKGRFHNKKKNGELYWAVASISPIRNSDNQITKFLAIQEDITEFERAQDTIDKQKRFLEKVLDINPNPIFVKDAEGKYVIANKALANVFGVTTEDMIGKTDSNLISSKEEIDNFLNYDKDVLEKLEERFIPEEPVTDKAGATRWFQTVKVPLIEDDGKARQLLGVATDITLHKKYAEEIKAKEQQLSLVFNSVSDAIYLLKVEENNYRFVMANESFCKFTGLSENDVINTMLDEIINKYFTSSIIEQCNTVRKTNQRLGIERELEIKNKMHFLETTLTPILDDDFECTHILVVNHDITMYKELDKMKSDLINTVSHEIRTPLASILGFTELMLTRELKPEKSVKYLSTIQKETKRLTNLINDFLDVQRMESGKQIFTMDKFDIVYVIKEVLELYSENSIHKFKFISTNKEMFVNGDIDKVKQLLNNLISNAVKYSPEGGDISIKACYSGIYIRIDIEDEGIGVPEDVIPKLFTKFYRIDNSDYRKIGGTGLGLAICKEIVQAHNGQIGVEAKKGKGSIFYFTLPQSQEKFDSLKIDEEVEEKYILIVEDDLSLAQLISEYIFNNGWSYKIVASAEEALDMIQKCQPQVIILDIFLSGSMNGWDMIDKLNEIQNRRKIPVVISTAFEKTEKKYDEQMYNAYFVKPFSFEKMIEKIDDIIKGIL